MIPPIPVRLISDQKIDTCLKGLRYPPIESVRIIQCTRTPSAIIKVRRRFYTIGGVAVTRVYVVYSARWLERWQRVQRALFQKGAS